MISVSFILLNPYLMKRDWYYDLSLWFTNTRSQCYLSSYDVSFLRNHTKFSFNIWMYCLQREHILYTWAWRTQSDIISLSITTLVPGVSSMLLKTFIPNISWIFLNLRRNPTIVSFPFFKSTVSMVQVITLCIYQGPHPPLYLCQLQ